MAIDYWCNIFTPEGIDKCFRQPEEVAEVVKWWGMEPRLVGRTVPEFISHLDDAGVEAVLVPSAKMNSWRTQQLLWNISEEEVEELTTAAPGRVFGLVGIDPREGLAGVRKLDHWVRERGFVGAHLHPYGYGLEVNHRRFYPFYSKCAELGVPLVVQIGHSAEHMPSSMGRPILLDDVALEIPELTIVAAHTGWPWIEEMVAIAWKHRNVYIGTSAHHPKYWDPALISFANSRGRGKVLFGTDYPVMDYADAIGAVRGLALRDEARELVLSGAANKIFKLEKRLAAAPVA
jgi:predicted TIM-barrel fold metal-dependent hydrolase